MDPDTALIRVRVDLIECARVASEAVRAKHPRSQTGCPWRYMCAECEASAIADTNLSLHVVAAKG